MRNGKQLAGLLVACVALVVVTSGFCCAPSTSCGSACCPAGNACVSGACCATAQVCGASCCPSGQSCVSGVCTASSGGNAGGSGGSKNQTPCTGALTGTDAAGNTVSATFSECNVTPLLQGADSSGNTVYDLGLTASPALSSPAGATHVAFSISGTQPALVGTFGTGEASGCLTGSFVYSPTSTTSKTFSFEGEVQGPDCNANGQVGTEVVDVSATTLLAPAPAPPTYVPHGTATITMVDDACAPCQGSAGSATLTLSF